MLARLARLPDTGQSHDQRSLGGRVGGEPHCVLALGRPRHDCIDRIGKPTLHEFILHVEPDRGGLTHREGAGLDRELGAATRRGESRAGEVAHQLDPEAFLVRLTDSVSPTPRLVGRDVDHVSCAETHREHRGADRFGRRARRRGEHFGRRLQVLEGDPLHPLHARPSWTVPAQFGWPVVLTIAEPEEPEALGQGGWFDHHGLGLPWHRARQAHREDILDRGTDPLHRHGPFTADQQQASAALGHGAPEFLELCITELAARDITDHEEVVQVEFLARGWNPRHRHVAFLGEVTVGTEQHDARFHGRLAHEDVLDVPVLPPGTALDHQHADRTIDDAHGGGGLVVRRHRILRIRHEPNPEIHRFARLGRGDQDVRGGLTRGNDRPIDHRARCRIHQFQPRRGIAQGLDPDHHRHLIADEGPRRCLHIGDRCITERLARSERHREHRNRSGRQRSDQPCVDRTCRPAVAHQHQATDGPAAGPPQRTVDRQRKVGRAAISGSRFRRADHRHVAREGKPLRRPIPELDRLQARSQLLVAGPQRPAAVLPVRQLQALAPVGKDHDAIRLPTFLDELEDRPCHEHQHEQQRGRTKPGQDAAHPWPWRHARVREP